LAQPCDSRTSRKLGEFHTWTEEEIAQFEAHGQIGARKRTAFALFVFTGQRAPDVKAMSWADQDKGAIRVVRCEALGYIAPRASVLSHL
jgi:integrase